MLDVGFEGDFVDVTRLFRPRASSKRCSGVVATSSASSSCPWPPEEARDFVLLVFGDVDEELGGAVYVAAEDEGLVLDDGERECERGDVHVLVADIDAAVARQVAE